MANYIPKTKYKNLKLAPQHFWELVKKAHLTTRKSRCTENYTMWQVKTTGQEASRAETDKDTTPQRTAAVGMYQVSL